MSRRSFFKRAWFSGNKPYVALALTGAAVWFHSNHTDYMFHEVLREKYVEQKPHIVITGLPGSGKSTQAQYFAQELDAQHISSGDVFRKEIYNGTRFSEELKSSMESGKLVSDNLSNRLVNRELRKAEEKGWVLDGHPRTQKNYEAMCIGQVKPDLVIVIDVDDNVAQQRCEGRLRDPTTNKIYHEKYNPPPKDAKVEKRNDDEKDIFKKRFKTQVDSISEMIKVVPKENLVTINGSGTIEETRNAIQSVLSQRYPKYFSNESF
mmetsp:Transcript_10782/g.15789  ORF Transcript_10782/g.15789 Transcript_10782/m.15789 type:complete len:264 (+) Transcript_10782:22-813(+)